MNDNLKREAMAWEAEHDEDNFRQSQMARNALLLWLLCVVGFLVAVSL